GRNRDLPLSERRFLEKGLEHSIQLLTYDDLAELSKQRALIVTKSVLVPLLPTVAPETTVTTLPARKDEIHTADEVVRALQRLSAAELLKLQNYAHWRIRGLGQYGRGKDEEDLLQEAILATVEGRRVWNKNVEFTTHLAGSMRSISSNWRLAEREDTL